MSSPTKISQLYSISTFLLQAVLGLLTMYLVTRYLDPEDLGVYRYVVAVISLVAVFTFPGFNKTIPGYLSKNFHGSVSSSMGLSLKGSVIGIIVLAIHGFYYNGSMKGVLFYAAAIVFIPYVIFSRYEFILQGLHLFKKIFYFKGWLSILQFFSAFIVLTIFEQGVLLFGLSQFLIQLFLFTSFYFYTISLLSNKKIDKEFINHSKTITYYGVVGRIILPSLQILLNSALGPESVALYFISKKISDMASNATHQLMRPISMNISSASNASDKYIMLKKIMPISLLIGIFFFIAIYFSITIFGKYLVGELYFDALEYAKIFSIVVIFTPFQSLLVSNAIYERKNRVYRDSLYINYAIQILGYSIFSHNYGLYAVSITFVIAYLANFLILFSSFVKYQHDDNKNQSKIK
jgi:O-antigen/teichoic acid export membrane protein